MKRLTYFDGGKWRLKIGDTEYSGEVADRLAAYEETGLEPEDFKQTFSEDTILKLAGQALGITPDRLRELAQTDKDGKIKAYIVIAFIAISARNGTPEQKKLRSI